MRRSSLNLVEVRVMVSEIGKTLGKFQIFFLPLSFVRLPENIRVGGVSLGYLKLVQLGRFRTTDKQVLPRSGRFFQLLGATSGEPTGGIQQVSECDGTRLLCYHDNENRKLLAGLRSIAYGTLSCICMTA